MNTLPMKKFVLSAMMALVILTACVKNEFDITFQFPKEHLGNYLVTYYAWDSRKGMWIENTASVQDGTAAIHCVTRKPTLIYITDASSPSNSIIIYAERGDDLKISGEGNDMMTWKVTGNRVSERWSEWRNRTASANGKHEEKKKWIEDFVKKNPSDKLSPILMLTEWDRAEDPDGFVRLWNSIDKDTRSHELTEMCGCPDLLGVEFTVNADGTLSPARNPKLKTLVVRSLDNGVDTLRLNKATASIMYFYSENNSERRETADSLKKLAKAYSDSTKRIIADIAVDTDSMTWISAIRNDSLKGAVRGWMPAGMADPDMTAMGITRTPWFQVRKKDGTAAYSGSDPNTAYETFRKEMNKKPAQKKVAKKQ